MVRIGSLFVQPVKKSAFVGVETVNLIENVGMEGDCHADGSDRQLTLISEAAAAQITAIKTGRPCLEKIQVNIILSDLYSVKQGSILQFENAALLITKKGRSCHGLCDLAHAGKKCPLVENLCFAKVEKSGKLTVGEVGKLL